MRLPDYSYVYEMEDLALRKEVMRQLCIKDLWFLCRHVLGFEDLETKTDIHLRLCHELDEFPKRYLVAIPRGHFKTSIMLANIIRVLCKDPSSEVGVGSDTAERAAKRVNDLRGMLVNPVLVELFPEIFYADPERQSDLWRSSEFNIIRPPRHTVRGGFRLSSVTAFGFDPMPTGSHYSYVYVDDLENDTNSDSDAAIKKLCTNLSAFFPVLPPEACFHMTGTIWAGDGQVGTGPMTTYQHRDGWKVYKRKVREGDGRFPNKPVFPNKFTEETLRQAESDMASPHLWIGQYLMEYQAKTSEMLFPFKDSKYESFKFEEQPEGGYIHREGRQIDLNDCGIYITVDPSGGADQKQHNSNSDKVGWCVNAVSTDGHWHFLELDEAYLSVDEFIAKLFYLHEKYRPLVMGVEKMPFLGAAMRQAFIINNKTLPLSELKHKGRAKFDRIRGLKPLIGGIHLREGTDQRRHFEGYYTDMKHGDDAIDAGAYQVDIATIPSEYLLKQRRDALSEAAEKAILATLPRTEQLEYKRLQKIGADTMRNNDSESDAWDDIYGGDENVSNENFDDVDW